jgi:hypothetical protein
LGGSKELVAAEVADGLDVQRLPQEFSVVVGDARQAETGAFNRSDRSVFSYCLSNSLLRSAVTAMRRPR